MTDHKAVVVTFTRGTNNHRGPGYWKLNIEYLKNDDYIKGVNEVIEYVQTVTYVKG